MAAKNPNYVPGYRRHHRLMASRTNYCCNSVMELMQVSDQTVGKVDSHRDRPIFKDNCYGCDRTNGLGGRSSVRPSPGPDASRRRNLVDEQVAREHRVASSRFALTSKKGSS